MVDLLLLFGGYATVFLVSPKRNNARVDGAIPGSLARSAGGDSLKVCEAVILFNGVALLAGFFSSSFFIFFSLRRCLLEMFYFHACIMCDGISLGAYFTSCGGGVFGRAPVRALRTAGPVHFVVQRYRTVFSNWYFLQFPDC